MQIMNLLDRLYRKFDDLTAKYGLFKVSTSQGHHAPRQAMILMLTDAFISEPDLWSRRYCLSSRLLSAVNGCMALQKWSYARYPGKFIQK